MLVHLTKRLSERLKITPQDAPAEYDPLYSWRANLVEDGNERIVVFMNDTSRYCVVLSKIKAKDWAKLPRIFIQKLRENLLFEQINPELIDLYITNAGNVSYVRNVDRKMSAWLNRACENACLAYRNYDSDVEMSFFVNHIHVGTKDEKGYWLPSERMFERFSVYELPVKKCRAFDLNTRLKVEEGWIQRRLLVPTEFTFEQFSKALKKAYGWWFDRQYCFMPCENGEMGADLDTCLNEKRDLSTFPPNDSVTPYAKLSDHFLEYRHCLYLHGFGEWTVYLELIGIIEDCMEELPCLLSGEGDAPPDGFGGAKGYTEFLDIMEHGNAKQRYEVFRKAKSYGWKQFDLGQVNEAVRRSFMW